MMYINSRCKAQKSDVQCKIDDEDHMAKCIVCSNDISPNSCTTLICPHNQCNAKSHMRCLAESFLDKENSENLMVPIKGYCPACEAETTWITLIKYLSRRIHGIAKAKEPKRSKDNNTTRNQAEKGRNNRKPGAEINNLDENIDKQKVDEG